MEAEMVVHASKNIKVAVIGQFWYFLTAAFTKKYTNSKSSKTKSVGRKQMQTSAEPL